MTETTMTLHAFKTDAHPNYSMGDVVLAGLWHHTLGYWDGFEFSPTLLGTNVFAPRIEATNDVQDAVLELRYTLGTLRSDLHYRGFDHVFAAERMGDLSHDANHLREISEMAS